MWRNYKKIDSNRTGTDETKSVANTASYSFWGKYDLSFIEELMGVQKDGCLKIDI